MRSDSRRDKPRALAPVVVLGMAALACILVLDIRRSRAGGSVTTAARRAAGSAATTEATQAAAPVTPSVLVGSMVVLGYNDLGMHCMNPTFSELCILPPYNNLHAEVIDRGGEEPRIVSNGVTVSYSIPGNTKSTTKTDFWRWAKALFGANLAPNVGLTGNGLAGTMKPTTDGDWAATGIPITPITDLGAENAYQLSQITVTNSRKQVVAKTAAVVPVSWEISCNLCHATPGITVETDILRKHDLKHHAKYAAYSKPLEESKPVLCAKCHADPALGTTGVAGLRSMSAVMHASHASRMGPVASMGNTCYACHPGFRTNCQRDVHFAKKIYCVDCHGGMAAVGNPARVPWQDEPRCETCHQKRRPDFAFEQPGKLFKESKGHHGVHCAACHGSPHATTPAVTAPDNVQSIALQGHAGPIGQLVTGKECTVCHRTRPDDKFDHRLDDDD